MDPSRPARRIVPFGAFELDLSTGELHKSGLKIRLQEQPFQVLARLLERPGQVVTREELRQRLWPKDTFVDFDHGLSTAIIEDRKWKSAPKEFLAKAQIFSGWPQSREYDAAKESDAPGAELPGQRQLDFLNAWAADWSGRASMKGVVSQTIFANLATRPKGTRTDDVTPMLRVMKPGEYPENEEPVMDHDSNGWPQTGRNQALRAMRRGFAVHIAGDQQLGSTIQYGIDHWNDASWAIGAPPVANVWPRRC